MNTEVFGRDTPLPENPQYIVLYIAKAPALTTIPESNAEIVEGALECASGSHAFKNNIAAVTPKPTIYKALITPVILPIGAIPTRTSNLTVP